MSESKKTFIISHKLIWLSSIALGIGFICITYHTPCIVTFEGEKYDINQSLNQIQSQLSSKQFFRVNRQYLIDFSAIKEVEHYFAWKLLVKLKVETPEKLLIRKEKTAEFLGWLDNR